MTNLSRSSLLTLRRRFAGLPASPAKDIGLRRLRDALRYVDRADMAAYVADMAASAAYQLPYAEVAR
jgi:hypothetical protein